MRIANFLPETEVEGPGLRAAIWLQGCSRRCPGCCNPGYLSPDGGHEVAPEELVARLGGLPIEGISILGGEPLDQAESLLAFLRLLRRDPGPVPGVMLFTGHPWGDLIRRPLAGEIIALCDLVKAGPFVEALAPDSRAWIGSTNQTIHFLSDRYRCLANRWPVHRPQVEFHLRDGEILMNGTPWPISPTFFGGQDE
jgi:anaerobic ribonucleoside-triphosphate reductase activating protein